MSSALRFTINLNPPSVVIGRRRGTKMRPIHNPMQTTPSVTPCEKFICRMPQKWTYEKGYTHIKRCGGSTDEGQWLAVTDVETIRRQKFLIILKFPWDAEGNLRLPLCRKIAYKCRILVERQGRFDQSLLSACNVKEVLIVLSTIKW